MGKGVAARIPKLYSQLPLCRRREKGRDSRFTEVMLLYLSSWDLVQERFWCLFLLELMLLLILLLLVLRSHRLQGCPCCSSHCMGGEPTAGRAGSQLPLQCFCPRELWISYSSHEVGSFWGFGQW